MVWAMDSLGCLPYANYIIKHTGLLNKQLCKFTNMHIFLTQVYNKNNTKNMKYANYSFTALLLVWIF